MVRSPRMPTGQRTVVLIHMRHATLAPMAAPPASPPRKALLDALSKISRKAWKKLVKRERGGGMPKFVVVTTAKSSIDLDEMRIGIWDSNPFR
eukprot:scaffold1953_cov176-Amphora_coffeaeformis.AAC.6